MYAIMCEDRLQCCVIKNDKFHSINRLFCYLVISLKKHYPIMGGQCCFPSISIVCLHLSCSFVYLFSAEFINKHWIWFDLIYKRRNFFCCILTFLAFRSKVLCWINCINILLISNLRELMMGKGTELSMLTTTPLRAWLILYLYLFEIQIKFSFCMFFVRW